MTLTVGQARRLSTSLLQATGLSADHALTTAQCIVLADCWGVSSHGLSRLPYYLERLLSGGYPPGAALRTVTDTGPLCVLDGGGGLGHWQLWSAAQLAAERALQHGISATAVGNSGHCGALGVYTLPALEHGLAAMVFSHGPAVMAPWGAAAPVLSTSPLAAGIPTTPRPAIIDMATTAVARGRIAEYARRGDPLPAGWGLDPDGRPTDDASVALAGLLAPLGGAKGFALALLVEALTAGMIGPELSVNVADMFAREDRARPQRIAHLVVVLDPARTDADGGARAVARLADLARGVEAAGGRLPGSSRQLLGEVSDEQELHITTDLEVELRSWATRLGAHPEES